jgi:hypothetical protein
VHLIVGPQARARSIDDLHARRHRPIGTGNATTSELLLSNYAVAAVMRDVGAALRLNPSVQGARGGRRYITLDNPWGQSDYPRYRLSIEFATRNA